ncbi:MAG: glycosyltransferase family 39 protein [Spirochaetales bacterium]|nr:glycosyltransferase family 39 protein [Spirochaetales bacterium]
MKVKYPYWSILVLVLVLSGCSSAVEDSTDLIKNGDFEKNNGTLPASWRTEAYDEEHRSIQFSVIKGTSAHSGDYCVKIVNMDRADSRFIQNVSVKPKSYYKITGWIRSEGIPERQIGGNLSVMDVFASSVDVRNSGEVWKHVELYGKTGPDQNSIIVGCRLGGYGEESRGTAFFDDISLYKLSGNPVGREVMNFYQDKSAKEEVTKESLNMQQAKEKTNAFFWIIIFSFLFLGLYFFLHFFFLEKDRLGMEDQSSKILILFVVFIGIAFLLRVIMGYLIEGQAGDLGCFKGWGQHAISTPWTDYYDYYSAYIHKAKYWCDYPPVYVMILAVLAWIQRIFQLGAPAYTLLIKMPNIISDIICCYLIYRLAKRHFHNTGALALSILYAFNPAIIINSAVWGQADAIYTLLALLVVIFILDNKLWLSGLVLGIALLIKIQTAFVAFAGIFALIEKKSAKDWVSTMAASLGIFFLMVLPFGIKLPFEWIFVQLIGTLTGYPFASVNAYNFFALFGGNWLRGSEPFLFGFSSDVWGIAIGYFAIIFMIFIYFYSKEKSKNYYIGLFAMAAIFMFIPGMHERYLYAVVVFSIMTYIYTKDRRFLYLFLGFSVSVFVNVYHILDVFIVQDMARAQYPDYPIEPLKEPVLLINSLANCFLFGYLVKVGVDVYIRKRLVVDTGHVYTTPLEVSREEMYNPERHISPKEKMKIESPKRNIVLITGLLSVLIPFLGLYPWIIGRKEMKSYPEDNVLRAGNLLGKGIIILRIVTFIIGLLVLLLFLSGVIEL